MAAKESTTAKGRRLYEADSAKNSAPYSCSEVWQTPQTQAFDLAPDAASCPAMAGVKLSRP